jgi:hypothetical protein
MVIANVRPSGRPHGHTADRCGAWQQTTCKHEN